MAQHDLIIDNAGGAVVRADINAALAALGSCMKGSSPPAFPLAGMLWLEEDNPSATEWTLKIYDGADWSAIGVLNSTTNVFTPSAAPATALLKAGDTMTGALTLPSSDPTDPDHAARKAYVDARVLKSGDTMTGALTLPASDPTNADHAARKAYVDAGDRWVSLGSVVPTAVSLIEFDIPTGYDLFRFYFSNLRHAGTVASGKDFYFRLAQGGSLLAGASDYYEQGPHWDGTTGSVVGGTTSYGRIFVSPNTEGIIGEATLWPGAGTANTRPILQARSFGLASNGNRWTVLLGTQCLVDTARATKIGFGWVGGDTFAAQGRIHMMGLKT